MSERSRRSGNRLTRSDRWGPTFIILWHIISLSFPSAHSPSVLQQLLSASWPLTSSPPRGQTEDTWAAAEVWCDWWSSGRVGSASVSLHNNVLVLSLRSTRAPGSWRQGVLLFGSLWWLVLSTSGRTCSGQVGVVAVQRLVFEERLPLSVGPQKQFFRALFN